MHGFGGKRKIRGGANEAHQHKIFLGEGTSGQRRSYSKASGDEANVCQPADEAATGEPVYYGERGDYRMDHCLIICCCCVVTLL